MLILKYQTSLQTENNADNASSNGQKEHLFIICVMEITMVQYRRIIIGTRRVFFWLGKR